MISEQDQTGLTLARHIDSVCDRFEQDWKSGSRPQIEQFLSRTQGQERAQLLEALLRVEVELLERQGIRLQPADYQTRFPDAGAIVSGVFQESGRRTAGWPGPPGDTSVSRGDSSIEEQATAAEPGPPVRQIGRFEVLQLLGQGAFGRVYKARDPQLDREVAIKVPLRGVLQTGEEVDRFLREAQTAASIQHANICPVHEVGQDGDSHYLVMAYIEGQTLGRVLKGRKEPLPARQIALMVRKLALALQVAHEKGIVHRDLKPANVMIDRHRKNLVIMDFGLARRRKPGDASQTQEGIVLGTPAYMAPEQACGQVQKIGPTSDVYSLGVLLYEMLAGRLPFLGNAAEVLGQVLHVEPEPPSRHRPGVDPTLEAICLQAMAKDPAGRFSSMQELADVLGDYLKGAGAEESDVKKPAGSERSSESKQLVEVVEKLSKERHQESREARAMAARHWLRFWSLLLTSCGGLAAVLIAGTSLFTGTPTVREAEVAIKDGTEALSPAPVPDVPNGPVERLVFEQSLSEPDILDIFTCSFSTYRARAFVEPNKGLWVGGGFRPPVVWPRPFLGDRYRVQFEVQLPVEKGWAGWVLNGAGYGNSSDTGYACRFDGTRFSLQREGEDVQSIELPRAIPPLEWVSVQAEVSSGRIAVMVNGMALAPFADPRPLRGPLHGWFGLTAGQAVFRNLRLWSFAGDPRQDLQLTPPVTDRPLANGKLLYELDLATGKLEPDWWRSDRRKVTVKKGKLIFVGGDSKKPALVLTQPLHPDLGCEIEFEYPTYEAVRFGMMLWCARKATESLQDCDRGWEVWMPAGSGRTTVQWRGGVQDLVNDRDPVAPFLASTPYHAPVAQRRYCARLETQRDQLRVFLDDGLLLTARRPDGAAPEAMPVFLGLRNCFTGTKVHAVRVYQIASVPVADPLGPGQMSLFNGKDLTGWKWTAMTRDNSWLVDLKEQALVNRGQSPYFSPLWSERVYADFNLKAEFKLARQGHAGVLIRGIPNERLKFLKIPTGDDSHQPAWPATGSLLFLGAQGAPPSTRARLKPPGEWNSLEIEARGSRIRVLVNGAETGAYDTSTIDPNLAARPEQAEANLKRPAGHIGLVCDRNEVRFRKITIQELK